MRTHGLLQRQPHVGARPRRDRGDPRGPHPGRRVAGHAARPSDRARLGRYPAVQSPTASPGRSVASFLRTDLSARKRPVDISPDGHDPSDMTRGGISMGDFRKLVTATFEKLAIDPAFATRYVNEG